MEIEPAALLLALQLADSGFPAGGFAFSWGLEGLAADGLVTGAADVAEMIDQHLALRWQGTDRVLLGRAHRADDDAAVQQADLLAQATTPCAPLREGSRRAGRALLAACTRLGLPRVATYRAAVMDDARLGHLPVVQGLAYRAAGLTLAMAELLSGWAVIGSLASAAVRLGLIGHVEALGIAAAARGVLARLLADPAPAAALPASFLPLVDIAVMRGRQRGLRMFAT